MKEGQSGLMKWWLMIFNGVSDLTASTCPPRNVPVILRIYDVIPSRSKIKETSGNGLTPVVVFPHLDFKMDNIVVPVYMILIWQKMIQK